ncbi:2079_t:CDS:10 [Paraglomus brasilianum]|uniref:Dynein heavy chain, cytoplasmic n=1 Tax=Paraglomus brasilianum TaxID=144538 RepID=A0A9N8W4C6_9GLOM|nr:2079_t:CDS:10 [Paraglomus brasilianum]
MHTYPRFYFVGDEDLLEIISNSKDVVRIQKHFKKMFAGVSNIILTEDNTMISGMASREGEEVYFKNPISIKENPKINDWLTMIEKEMKVSLALLLADAVPEMNTFYLADELDTALTTMSEGDQNDQTPINDAIGYVLRGLEVLADTVLQDLPPTKRKKCEHLITELVHQLLLWIRIPNRLVQTPLTDRCHLTLTQALEGRLGGSPFGPADTGKIESVKALVGAWGCFDEFNRLEERILSAVSQQVQIIQLGLKVAKDNPNTEIEIVGKSLKVNTNTGIFITMNPGYAGRSNLPDNLKKLFRSIAMTKPDRELNAGNLKCERLHNLRKMIQEGTKTEDEHQKLSEPVTEQEILIQSIRETIVPKLSGCGRLPWSRICTSRLEKLKEEIIKVCGERRLIDGKLWTEKVLQLYQIQNIHHGLMVVVLANQWFGNALERVQDSLYGTLDQTTREWTDRLFTHILRKIIDNVRGESSKRHWIIFDGDVDPEWVENLNSVLGDNRLLTLPNGERLSLPGNVRIIFEVEMFKYATLATIYGTFSRAMLKVVPSLRAYAEPLTAAMVDLYLMSQKRFTPDIQAHYIYSPPLRLFQDRFVTEERKWTDDNIDSIAIKHFPSLNQDEALGRPILFSNWLSKYYIPVDCEEPRDYIKARLKVFYEEELDVQFSSRRRT